MKSNFEYFLDKFPLIEMPITLTEEMYTEFNKHNDVLQNELIAEFITPYDATDPDDATEIVPCLKLKNRGDINFLLYWRASVLNYSFILASYNKLGKMIDKKSIAGMEVNGNKITRTAAVINDDYSIAIVEGAEEIGKTYDAESSKVGRFEINDLGQIDKLY